MSYVYICILNHVYLQHPEVPGKIISTSLEAWTVVLENCGVLRCCAGVWCVLMHWYVLHWCVVHWSVCWCTGVWWYIGVWCLVLHWCVVLICAALLCAAAVECVLLHWCVVGTFGLTRKASRSQTHLAVEIWSKVYHGF